MFFLDCVKLLNNVVFCSVGQNQRLRRVICKGDKVFFVEVNENFSVVITKTPFKGKFGKVVYQLTRTTKTPNGSLIKHISFSDGFSVCGKEDLKYIFSIY